MLDLASMLEAATPWSRISGINSSGELQGGDDDRVPVRVREPPAGQRARHGAAVHVQHHLIGAEDCRGALILPPRPSRRCRRHAARAGDSVLPRWICQSYRFHFGAELIKSADANSSSESVLKAVWHHPSAILYCSLKVMPVFTFANRRRRRRQAQDGGGGEQIYDHQENQSNLCYLIYPTSEQIGGS